MTSLTGGARAENDLKELMQQIIAERDAKFAPQQEGGAAGPTTGMFDKPEIKPREADAITDLLGYLEQKRAEALESYQSKVMRKASKPLPKPEDVDVSSFLTEAGLSPMADPLVPTDTPDSMVRPQFKQVADTFVVNLSKDPAEPMSKEEPAVLGLMAPETSPRPVARSRDVEEVSTTEDTNANIQQQIAKHEGQINYPYKDSLGKWTIGIGHLIGDGSDKALANSGYKKYSEDNPMPESEVAKLFQKDLKKHRKIAEGYDFYDGMSETGKRAILDLTFNMGDFLNKKKKDGTYVWEDLRTQLSNGDWDAAADNLLSAEYANQVGDRAITVTDMLREAGN